MLAGAQLGNVAACHSCTIKKLSISRPMQPAKITNNRQMSNFAAGEYFMTTLILWIHCQEHIGPQKQTNCNHYGAKGKRSIAYLDGEAVSRCPWTPKFPNNL